MPVYLIAAVSENGVIGKDGHLPWHVPEDLKRFKHRTTGHAVLMGRKTWESIPEKHRPLPDRTNIVVTRQTDYPLPQTVERFATIKSALAAHHDDTVFIIGGGEIYRQTMEMADRIYLTRVRGKIKGDVFFPDINPRHWVETDREDHGDYAYMTFERQR